MAGNAHCVWHEFRPVSWYLVLCQIGREDLANDLDKMVEKEMAFRFENSPFHVRDSKRRDLSPGEKEMKMERTLNEMIDDYIKEFEEDDKGE